MEHVEYVYMVGMDEAELGRRLAENEVGVLSLADEGVAYGIPVNYRYADERLLLRLSDVPGSEKAGYVETTEEASFLVYDAEGEWSVVVRGTLRRLPKAERFDDLQLNETFDVLRVFDEDVAELDVVVYELEMTSVTGRRAVQ